MMREKFSVFFMVFIFGVIHTISSQNLVPNPSFEFNSSCPTGIGSGGNANSGLAVVNSWNQPVGQLGSSDYFNSCNNNINGVVGVPSNALGNEVAATGNGYTGIMLYTTTSPNYREYLQSQLSSPLVAGESYTVSFKYSVAEESSYYSDDLGIHLSSTQVSGAAYQPIAVLPQISIQGPFTDTSGWTVVTTNYVASGGEEYITLGSFKNDMSISLTPVSWVPSYPWPVSFIFIDDVSIVLQNCNVDLGSDTVLCEGDSLILNVFESGATYLWQDGSEDSTYLVLEDGVYHVQLTDSIGCVSYDSIEVSVIDFSVLDIGNDTAYCWEEPILLDAYMPEVSYLWQDGSVDSLYEVTEPGLYWVTLNSYCGSVTDSIQIDQLCESILNMPNVFTPNGDGQNDVFKASIMEGIETVTLQVYNRWGQLLYETNNLQKGWDGNKEDKPCPEGTYYWLVSYSDTYGELGVFNGVFSLMR